MADVTRENLQQKLTGLRAQHKQTYDQVMALEGAIALCQQLITEIEAPPTPDPVKT